MSVYWGPDDDRATPCTEARRIALAVGLALGLALLLWGSALTLLALWLLDLAGVWS